MDQHPIPQDVTGFQFKLIGTMTVKQFGYVASGVILAVIFYYLPLQSAWGILLKVFLVPLFGASGVIVAFVPIDGRPIDIMTTNFTRALFSPNQYIYHRQGRRLSFETVSVVKAQPKKAAPEKNTQPTHPFADARQLNEKEEKLRALLMSSHGDAKNAVDKKEAAFLQALTMPKVAPAHVTRPVPIAQPVPVPTIHPTPTMPSIKPTIVAQPVASLSQVKPVTPIIAANPAPMPQPQIAKQQPMPQQMPQAQPAATPSVSPNQLQENELQKKEIELEQALSQAKQEESTSTTPATQSVAQHKVSLLTKQIQAVHSQKEQLERELTTLKQQLATQKSPAPVPSPSPAAPIQAQATVQPQSIPVAPPSQYAKVIPQPVNKKADLPRVSDSPNVVVGIVKDPRGNILPNILVEVKDKDGNPVRAFKTNQLGQFASATPLSPGTYTMELEDPKKLHNFDVIQVIANNQVLLPIEVISHDAREELRRQLFTN